MKARFYMVTQPEENNPAKYIFRHDIDFTTEIAKGLIGFSPIKPNLKDRDDFMGIWHNGGVISKGMMEYTLMLLFDKDVEIRKSLCSYLGGHSNYNTMSVNEGIKLCMEFADRQHDKSAVYADLLDIMGLLTVNDYVAKRLTSGHNALCKEAFGSILSDHSGENTVQMIYKDDCYILIHEHQKYMAFNFPFDITSFKPITTQSMTIDIRPVVEVLGKINLDWLRQPNRITQPWLKSVADKLKIDIKGLEQNNALDKIYETLNNIRGKGSYELNEPYLLLNEKFIKDAPITGSPEVEIDFNLSVLFMSRRQGMMLLPGNPNFNEATLKDGAKWYIARIM